MRKIMDGFLYGIGAFAAFQILGLLVNMGIWAAYIISSILFSGGSLTL